MHKMVKLCDAMEMIVEMDPYVSSRKALKVLIYMYINRMHNVLSLSVVLI